MKFLPASRVSDVLSEHPDLLEVFRKFGFNALANPVLRATLARRVTIEEACERHRVRTEEFLKALDDALTAPAAPAAVATAVAPGDCACGGAGGNGATGDYVIPSMSTGECVGRYPETRAVFAGFFGTSCFTCPAFGTEDLYTACMMHGVPVEDFIAACNHAVTAGRGATPVQEKKTWVSAGMTVADILRNYPEAAPVLSHHGLDTCCGGMHPIGMACQHHGIDLARVLADVDRAIQEKRG